MKTFSLVTTLLALGLIAPAGSAYALDLDAIIEAAKENGTYVETHSSASTGGQTVRGGESIKTNDASASSHTEINAGSNGGSVKVKIETSKNGETQTKEYSQEIPAGGVKVEANATADDGGSSAEVKVDGKVVEGESQTASAGAAFNAKVSLLFSEKIPRFVKKFLNLFAWF